MARKYQSRIAETVRKTAAGLHGIGAIDKTTMREFDVLCLTMVEERSAREVHEVRKKIGARRQRR